MNDCSSAGFEGGSKGGRGSASVASGTQRLHTQKFAAIPRSQLNHPRHRVRSAVKEVQAPCHYPNPCAATVIVWPRWRNICSRCLPNRMHLNLATNRSSCWHWLGHWLLRRHDQPNASLDFPDCTVAILTVQFRWISRHTMH